MHTLRVETLAQSALPGVQTRVWQVPPLHESVAAQAALVYPRPSALHARRVARLVQVAAPGVQTRAWQRPAAQLWLVPQGTSV